MLPVSTHTESNNASALVTHNLTQIYWTPCTTTDCTCMEATAILELIYLDFPLHVDHWVVNKPWSGMIPGSSPRVTPLHTDHLQIISQCILPSLLSSSNPHPAILWDPLQGQACCSGWRKSQTVSNKVFSLLLCYAMPFVQIMLLLHH